MEALTTWFEALTTLQQVFWVCAGVSTLIFLIQFILTLVGMDSADMDVDVDTGDTMDLGGGLSLFSVRNLINFFVGFGWAGISFEGLIPNPVLLTVVATIVGIIFVVIFFYLRRQLMRLETDGAFKIEECIDTTADVYLRIPAAGEGKGKVQLSAKGSIHELDAFSTGEAIRTGAKVRIVEVVDSSTVKVQPV